MCQTSLRESGLCRWLDGDEVVCGKLGNVVGRLVRELVHFVSLQAYLSFYAEMNSPGHTLSRQRHRERWSVVLG